MNQQHDRAYPRTHTSVGSHRCTFLLQSTTSLPTRNESKGYGCRSPSLGMRRRTLVLLALLLVLASCGAAQPAPSVLQGDIRVHDPSLIRHGETYYVFSTGDEYGLNQGNIQIRRSNDLASWELVGTVFPIIPDWIDSTLGSTRRISGRRTSASSTGNITSTMPARDSAQTIR
jgi:hypothetical protein